MFKLLLKRVSVCLIAMSIIAGISTGMASGAADNITAYESSNSAGSDFTHYKNMPDIKADSAILMESKLGQILYGKDPDKKFNVPTACRLMTAIIALEKTPPDTKVTVSKVSSKASNSDLNLTAGEKYTVEELLYAIMLSSSDDAAIALSEYISGDEAKFVELMNTKAIELNMKNTYFINCTGAYDTMQYSTAYDISILTRYALNNPIFYTIFTSKGKPWSNRENDILLVNKNELLWNYDGVEGSKTDDINDKNQAGVTAAARTGLNLISVILNSPQSNVYNDTRKLLDYGFDYFKTGILVSKGQPFKRITVNNVDINLISISDVYYAFSTYDNYIQNIEFKTVKNLVPPIRKDSIVGNVKFVLKDKTVIDVNLYPDREILTAESFFYIFIKTISESGDISILLIILVSLELILAVYNVVRFIRKKLVDGK